VAIATGTQIPGTSSYVIDIDDTRLNPIDTRVTLNFQATGLDEVNLVIAGRTPGTAQQVIDPVMPKKVTYPPTCYPTYYPAPACCHHSGRCLHLFRPIDWSHGALDWAVGSKGREEASELNGIK